MYRAVLKSQPDRALVRLAAQGSEPAFEVIVLRYRRPLLGYCRRLALSESRAEDVVQQTFLNAWGSLRQGTEVRELRPWLYRITHNQAVSLLRFGPGEASLSDLLSDSAGCPGPDGLDATASVEEVYERQSRLRETLSAVADLPELQREALLATAVDGLSYEQVATALNTSGDAVRGLVYRARNSLRAGIAVVSPSPVVLWAAERASQPVSGAAISQWLTEAAAGGGSVGIGAAAIKGAALVASSAAVVTGTVGTALDRQVFGGTDTTSGAQHEASVTTRHASGTGAHAALATVPISHAAQAALVRGTASRSAPETGSGRPGAVLGSSGTRQVPRTSLTGSDSASSGWPSGSIRSGTAPSRTRMTGGGSAMAISQPLGAPPEEMGMRPSGQRSGSAATSADSSTGTGAASGPGSGGAFSSSGSGGSASDSGSGSPAASSTGPGSASSSEVSSTGLSSGGSAAGSSSEGSSTSSSSEGSAPSSTPTGTTTSTAATSTTSTEDASPSA